MLVVSQQGRLNLRRSAEEARNEESGGKYEEVFSRSFIWLHARMQSVLF